MADRIARIYGLLRGAMLVLLPLALIFAPERAMPGSSAEPARALALMFASRTIVLGLALLLLSARAKRAALGWVLAADAVFQLFDTGMALATGKGAIAVLPVILCGLDVWASMVLLRGRTPSPS